MISSAQQKKLNQILSRVGDMGFKRRVVEIINGLDLQPGDKVLDCGCGEGFYTMTISELYPQVTVTGFDHDQKILSLAKKWLKGKKNVRLVAGKAEGLPFKDGQFDKLILSEVIEHVDDDVKVLREARRVIKKGGLMVITVPSANYPFFWDPLNFIREHLGLGHFSGSNKFLGGVWSWNHLRLYTPETLSKAVKQAKLIPVTHKPILRFVLPFNYWLLFLGKTFYTLLPVPKTVSMSLEKFQWKDKGHSSALTKALKFPLDVVDSLNTRFPGSTNNRHLCLYILTKK